VRAVTFNRERRREAVIMPEDLPDWWARVQALGILRVRLGISWRQTLCPVFYTRAVAG